MNGKNVPLNPQDFSRNEVVKKCKKIFLYFSRKERISKNVTKKCKVFVLEIHKISPTKKGVAKNV